MLVSVVPALAVLLVVDVLMRGRQPLAQTLAARAWVYAAIAGLAVVAHGQRQRWLRSLDRHFFREHYDAQQLLRRVAEDIRQVGDFTRVAPRVVAQIEAALHPEFVALLVREPSELHYRSLVAAPAGLAPPPLRVDSKLVALLRIFGKPLEVACGQEEWLTRQLPRRGARGPAATPDRSARADRHQPGARRVGPHAGREALGGAVHAGGLRSAGGDCRQPRAAARTIGAARRA